MNNRWVAIVLLALVTLGSPLWALFCPGCGMKAADDAKFCAQCGKALPRSGAVVVPSDTPPQPPPHAPAVPVTTPAPVVVPVPVAFGAPPSPQAFQVTSHYLLVNGYRVSRNALFWIAEINGDSARVWSVDGYPSYGLIMGWVPLAELAMRSSWKTGAVTYCVEPPPPTAEVVVVHDRPCYRNWHPRPIVFSWSSHDRGHHRGSSDRHGRSDRHGSSGRGGHH